QFQGIVAFSLSIQSILSINSILSNSSNPSFLLLLDFPDPLAIGITRTAPKRLTRVFTTSCHAARHRLSAITADRRTILLRSCLDPDTGQLLAEAAFLLEHLPLLFHLMVKHIDHPRDQDQERVGHRLVALRLQPHPKLSLL